MIFGNKLKFAIEIEQSSEFTKGFMRLWIQNNMIGAFKRKAEFIHAVYDFRFFLKNYKSLYEEFFLKMTPEEINDYVLAEDLIWSENPKDLEEAGRRKIYVRFLGDQFDGICSFLSLFKEDTITWIIWNYKNKKHEFQSFDILFKEYESAFSEYTLWFNNNLAVFYPEYKK